jgi:hypothetical protein
MALGECDPRYLKIVVSDLNPNPLLPPLKEIVLYANQRVSCDVFLEDRILGLVPAKGSEYQYLMSPFDQFKNAEMRDALATIHTFLKILNRVV